MQIIHEGNAEARVRFDMEDKKLYGRIFCNGEEIGISIEKNIYILNTCNNIEQVAKDVEKLRDGIIGEYNMWHERVKNVLY